MAICSLALCLVPLRVFPKRRAISRCVEIYTGFLTDSTGLHQNSRKAKKRGAVCINLLTPVSNPLSAVVPLPVHTIFIDELSAVCEKYFIRCIDQVTNEALNSPAQTQTEHQVLTPYPLIPLARPSFPSRPGTSVLTDCHSEGPLVINDYARHRTRKGKCTRRRGMSFGQISYGDCRALAEWRRDIL